jgi:hypothetical protein
VVGFAATVGIDKYPCEWYSRPALWPVEELAASLAHLQRVDAAYWEREWRRDHKGLGIYPEDHLWRATHGYLDLLAATRAAGSI